jgi:teichuronic acid biosynthesis protein TuaE
MRRDYYPLLMGLLIGSAVIGLAVKYDNVYFFHVVLALVLLRGVFARSPGTVFCRFRPPSSYHHFFGFLGGWFALGLIWSWERTYTLDYLRYIACGGFLSVALLKYIGGSPARFESLFSIAKWLFLVDMAVGLLEAFTAFRLPVSPMAEGGKVYLNHEDSIDGLKYVLTMPTGFHWNPNNYAVVMLMLLPFFLFDRRWLVKIGGLATVTTLVFYAGSRGCLAAMAIMMLAATLYARQRAWMFAAAAAVAVGGCVLLGGLFTNYDHVQNPKLREALSTVSALTRYLSPDEESDTNSVGVRRQLIRNGLDALHETYGLGVGGGADRYVQEQYRWTVVDFSAMHNFWAELLVGGGYFFFAVLVIWYGRMTFELFQWSRRLGLSHRLGYHAGALSLALVGFLPAAISASTAIYILPMYILFGMSVAMVNVCRVNSSDRSAAQSGAPTTCSERPPWRSLRREEPSPHRVVHPKGTPRRAFPTATGRGVRRRIPGAPR